MRHKYLFLLALAIVVKSTYSASQQYLAERIPGAAVVSAIEPIPLLPSKEATIPSLFFNAGSTLVLSSFDYSPQSRILSLEVAFPSHGWIVLPDTDDSSIEQGKYLEFIVAENCQPSYIHSINVLHACTLGNYWMRNWPIGSGEIGALVGGTPSLDRIPLAISDLFVGNKKSIVTTFSDFIHAAGSTHDEFKIATRFQECTDLLVKGDVAPVAQKAGTMETNNRAQFEFMGDVVISYSNVDLTVPANAAPKIARRNLAAKKTILAPIKPQPKPRPRPVIMGNSPGIGLSSKRVLPPGLRHVSLLNMGFGSSSDTYVLGGGSLHHREWIGDQKWNVIMGRLSCTSGKSGCLGFDLSLERTSQGPREVPMVKTQGYQPWSAQIGSGKNDVVQYNRIGLTLTSSEDSLVAYSFMCVAVVCHGDQSSISIPSPVASAGTQSTLLSNNASLSKLHHYLNTLSRNELTKEGKQSSISCPAADNNRHADVFVSITKEDNDEVLLKEMRKANTASRQVAIEEKCWKNIVGVIQDASVAAAVPHPQAMQQKHHDLAKTELLQRSKFVHEPSTTSFQEMYDRMRITLNPDNLKNIDFNMSGGIRGGAEDDVHIKDIQEDLAVISKLAPLLAIGRFMFLAGATKGPSNLQGVWADGRDAMWSGDYHLNINMQMQYWAMDTFRLSETVPPLLNFIKRVTKNGMITAQAMYNCPGWVAHGYTDGFVITAMGGAPHWAFCVTCGAWLILHVWDHFTFTADLPMLRDHLLPAFEGMAQFFSNYMIPCNDKGQCDTKGRNRYQKDKASSLLYHTGPTGSPENSYGFSITGGKSGFSAVSFTPAIDASVLRQCASAYELASRLLLRQYAHEPATPQQDIQRAKEHLTLAESFKTIVSRMPYGALPVVSKAGGILEYPAPLLADVQTDAIDSPTGKVKINEDADKGHRHFSHMHWLYPGVFLPKFAHKTNGGDAVSMFSAAKGAMQRRSASGHTGWSAVWQAALWARLWKGKEAWMSIKRLLTRYTTDRYFTLHPKLRHTSGPMTAFAEDTAGGGFNSINEVFKRSMVTNNGAMFQFDANMGVLAAFGELILQTHYPGIIAVLPALPPALKFAGGSVEGMAGRGDVLVSLAWQGCSAKCDIHHHRHGEAVGALTSLNITAVRAHPWYAMSPDFTGESNTKSQHFNASLGSRKLAGKQSPIIGGLVEDDAKGFFSWRESALESMYSMHPDARQSSSTMDDIAIVYPRIGQKHLRLVRSHASSESEAATRDDVCGHILRLSPEFAAANPDLHVNSLASVLLGDYVGVSKTAHFSSIVVRVNKFPCKLVFRPE